VPARLDHANDTQEDAPDRAIISGVIGLIAGALSLTVRTTATTRITPTESDTGPAWKSAAANPSHPQKR
jgi:hypothetical protein